MAQPSNQMWATREINLPRLSLVVPIAEPNPEGPVSEWPIKIFTLGQFSIVKDGEPIAFSRKTPKKPIALLKAIVAFGGHEVPELRVAAALWADVEGDSAHEAFRITLHRLRKFLGDNDVIILRDRRISLNAERCWVDASAFENLLKDAGSNPTCINPCATEKALALYDGAFLPAELEEPWTLSLRERLRDKFARHSITLGGYYEHTRDWQAAIRCYRRGLDADDLSEDFYQGLMRCYLHLDRRAEGLAIYRRLQRTLSIILGIKPSAASKALHRALLDE